MKAHRNTTLNRGAPLMALTLALLAAGYGLALPRALAGGSAAALPLTPAKADPAKPADFVLTDLAGKLVHLKDYRGHPVVVDFWATWCPPCRKQMPELNKIYARYRASGLVVLGVSCDTIKGDGVKAIKPFVKEYGVRYPILLADDDVTDRFDVRGIPTTVFIDRDGRVVARMEGAGRQGELSEGVANLLKGAKPRPNLEEL